MKESIRHWLISPEEHEEFDDKHGVTVLKCNGRYLRGSGFDEALTINGILGKLILNQVIEDTHYVRALYGILLTNDLVLFLSAL